MCYLHVHLYCDVMEESCNLADSEETSIARHQQNKCISTVMNNHATTAELFK
jgi:hypothetical protein